MFKSLSLPNNGTDELHADHRASNDTQKLPVSLPHRKALHGEHTMTTTNKTPPTSVELMKARGMNKRIGHERLDISATSGGVKLKAEIAMCSWNHGSGVTMIVTFAESYGGKFHVRDDQLAVEIATEADYQRMLNTVQVCPCSKCHGPAFQGNREEDQCERCFLSVLDAELKKGQDKEAKKLAKMDAEQKALGYTHRIEAVLHRDGGDKQVSFWMDRPTPKEIKAEIKKLGSLCEPDYQLIKL